MSEGRTVVIGAGLNGVAAATMLARAGHRVTLVDDAPRAGGMLRPHAVQAGLSCSMASAGQAAISREAMYALDLQRHGLVLAPYGGIAAVAGERRVLLGRNRHATARHLDTLKRGEAARFNRLRTELHRVRTLLTPWFERAPFSPGNGDVEGFRSLMDDAFRLGPEVTWDMLNLASSSVMDRLGSDLGCEALRVLLAGACLAGQSQGPMTQGSALSLAFQSFMASDPAEFHPAQYGAVPVGGFETLSRALERAAEAAGVDLQLNTRAVRIHVDESRVQTVVLENGQELRVDAVVSSLDLKRTVEGLLNWQDIPATLSRRVTRVEREGTVARLFITVGSLEFLSDEMRALKPASIMLAPSLERMALAGDCARDGRVPECPWLEVTIPALADPMAPDFGPHLVCVSVHHVPWSFHDGPWTDQRRTQLLERVLTTMAGTWPGLLNVTTDSQLWLPCDIEQRFGRSGGVLTGLDHAPDRLFGGRPLPGLSGYGTPVDGLYLCGPDTHALPGHGGLNGVNAARAVLAEAARPEPRTGNARRWPLKMMDDFMGARA